MTNEQIQALKALCVKAGGGEWIAFIDSASSTFSVHTPGDERCGDVIKWAGFDGQKNAKAKAKFIAAANPAAILSLLAEREADKALIAELKKYAEAEAVGSDKVAEDAVYWMKRCKELEARTLTVKLPPNVDTSNVPFAAHTWNAYRSEAIKALESACTVAGITLVVGGEDAQG